METNSTFLGFKFLNNRSYTSHKTYSHRDFLSGDAPQKHPITGALTHTTNLVWKMQKEYSFVIIAQQAYSRTATDVDSSKIAKSTSVMFMN